MIDIDILYFFEDETSFVLYSNNNYYTIDKGSIDIDNININFENRSIYFNNIDYDEYIFYFDIEFFEKIYKKIV